jgi:hypothetical protein
MKVKQMNAILKLYGIQAKKHDGDWYVASVRKPEGRELLWGRIFAEGNNEEVCEYILNHLDTYLRYN